MACCGQRRSSSGEMKLPTGINSSAFKPSLQRAVYEYVGESSMVVVGAITGTSYRFPSRGTRAEIRTQDAAFMDGVPNLRKLK
jgi:hypothetical protein